MMHFTKITLVCAVAALSLGGDVADPKFTEHFAFRPVMKVQPPEDPTGWAESSVDQFIAATQREVGVQPVEQADRAVLARRVFFDLVGLPPTPDEVAGFVKDTRPDAFERLVDRLLASPRYGERWGRHWLDVARYADTAGENGDHPVPEMYRYRDYVVDAFDEDLPYDRFLHEQLAGDILAKNAREDVWGRLVVATGFISLARRFGTQAYQYKNLEIDDMIDTTSRAVLGLTLRCARCHDHKFDPLTTRDYYALYGMFESTTYPFTGSEGTKERRHLVSLDGRQEEFDKRLDDFKKERARVKAEFPKTQKEDPLAKKLAELRPQLEKLKEAQAKADEAKNREEIAALEKEIKESQSALNAKIAVLQKELDAINEQGQALWDDTAFAVREAKPTDVHVHKQGDPEEKGELVRRNSPTFFSHGEDLEIPAGTSGRLQLARWFTERRNPLTARVMVNRIWRHHFGRGIVGTPSNFGVTAAPPTHPRLLDWLASRFVDSGWSVKTMHRTLLLTQTYRLSVRHHDANSARDEANSTYWRFERRQLDAEALRDALLAVSGDLDLARPGPHPFPPVKAWMGHSQHNPFRAVYPSNHRSVYLMTQRLQRHPYLAIFDGADPNQTTGARTESIVPQQSLFLMNHPFVRERAAGLARRLIDGAASHERVSLACRLAWGRVPSSEEVDQLTAHVERYRAQLVEVGASPADVELESWSSLARLLVTANEFLYVD